MENEKCNHSVNYPAIQPADIEKYSSAITLSDMEIFVFPDILYPLVLANIMSPRIWAWKKDPWFDRFDRLTPYRRILRLKQYIIDHYEFNLDLDTWGLTTQEKELTRFTPYMSEETIAQSNALFGYEGDKYYFDLDIRRHFGLDRYTSNVIPYWKTETVEAMDSFRHKAGYSKGAGECVSLSTLYAAALYILCGIPLEEIFLIGTPLHSQNFIAINDGILTNNRRLVTKAMWFNGTELTTKARRALEHERISLVGHISGWVHTVYPEASIDTAAYSHFQQKLQTFLTTPISMEILLNFLRQAPERQRCFQIEHTHLGKHRWIPAETAYAFENSCPYKVSDNTRDKLLAEMDSEDFFATPLSDRIPLNKFEEFFRLNHIDLDNEDDRKKLAIEFDCYHIGTCEIVDELRAFCRLIPQWPDVSTKSKLPPPATPIHLAAGLSREEIIHTLQELRTHNPTADLAFYAFRDMSCIDWQPFLKAAFERSPVCVDASRTMDIATLLKTLNSFSNESIYDGTRLAQPDEMWNVQRGDGAEKAITFAAILRHQHPNMSIQLDISSNAATVHYDEKKAVFQTHKGLCYNAMV